MFCCGKFSKILNYRDQIIRRIVLVCTLTPPRRRHRRPRNTALARAYIHTCVCSNVLVTGKLATLTRISSTHCSVRLCVCVCVFESRGRLSETKRKDLRTAPKKINTALRGGSGVAARLLAGRQLRRPRPPLLPSQRGIYVDRERA